MNLSAYLQGVTGARFSERAVSEPRQSRAPQIKTKLQDLIEPLCRELLPLGHRRGREWVEASTAQGGLGDSLSVCIDGSKRGVWVHAAANAGGDPIDLVAHVVFGDVSRKADALRWAEDWIGPSWEAPPANAQTPRVSPLRAPARPTPARNDLAELARGYVDALSDSPGATYLEGRGIPGHVAAAYGVGFAQPGTYPGRADGKSDLYHPTGRVIFPQTLPDGRITSMSGRAITDDGVKAMNLPGPEDGSPTKSLFNARALREGDGPLFVTEAPMDALTLAAAGYTRVVALFGLDVPAWFWDELDAPGIVLALDNDARGHQAAAKIAEKALSRGLRVQRIPVSQYGGHKDLNDAWCAGALGGSGQEANEADSVRRPVDAHTAAQGLTGTQPPANTPDPTQRPRDEAVEALPADLAQGLAQLRSYPGPAAVSGARWDRFVDDVVAFERDWLALALQLGWTLHELFGLHRTRPEARPDCAGLVWSLQGRSIVRLDATGADVAVSAGHVLRYRRARQVSERALAWELVRGQYAA